MDSQGASCPREFLNIKVPLGHPYNPNNLTDLSMPFLRTRYNGRTGYSPNNPRQQVSLSLLNFRAVYHLQLGFINLNLFSKN